MATKNKEEAVANLEFNWEHAKAEGDKAIKKMKTANVLNSGITAAMYVQQAEDAIKAMQEWTKHLQAHITRWKK